MTEQTTAERFVSFFIDSFGNAFVPRKFRPYIKEFLFKAGIYEVPYTLFGAMFWIANIFTFTTFFLVAFDFGSGYNLTLQLFIYAGSWILFFFLYYFMFGSILYGYYVMRIYHRTKELEDRMADYLTLVSTNLKGGLSFEKSLWASIKPEFGVLANEIALVSKKVMTGSDVNSAMTEFADKYNSPSLRRAINLIIGEMESGGKIVNVIDKVIENLKKSKQLKEEMAASTLTYIIFIGALVIAICPLLFSLSFQLVKIMIGFGAKVGAAGGGGSLPINFSQSEIEPQHFRIFSVVAVTIIASFSAMIVSIIQTGNIRGGLRYIPLFLLSGLFFLFLFSIVFDVIFSNLIVI